MHAREAFPGQAYPFGSCRSSLEPGFPDGCHGERQAPVLGRCSRRCHSTEGTILTVKSLLRIAGLCLDTTIIASRVLTSHHPDCPKPQGGVFWHPFGHANFLIPQP